MYKFDRPPRETYKAHAAIGAASGGGDGDLVCEGVAGRGAFGGGLGGGGKCIVLPEAAAPALVRNMDDLIGGRMMGTCVETRRARVSGAG